MSVGTERVADQARKQMAATLRAIKGYRQLTDGQIGARIGRTGQSVNTYMAGRTGVDAGLIVLLAKALDVEPQVLFLTPNDALQWILDNRPEPLPRARAESRSRRKMSRRPPAPSTGWFTARDVQDQAA